MSDEIVLIEISDDSLKNLGVWPLPRDFHAALVDVLRKKGARMVIFDILFSEPTLYDEVFSGVVKEAGNVYFPLAMYIDEKKTDKKRVPQAPLILADLVPSLSAEARGLGHINVFLDADGKIRKIPLFVKFEDRLIPQMGFKAACDRLGYEAQDVTFAKNRLIIDGKLSIPVVGEDCFLVNYPGLWQKSFQHLSYFEILKAYTQEKEGKEPSLDLAVLKDKVCFVGLTAAGTSDFRAVPLETVYPLVGLQASVFNSLVNQQFITYVGDLANALIALFLFVLSLVLCLRLGPIKALLGNFILGFTYLVISVVSFLVAGVWMDLFLPLLTVIAVYVISTAARFFAETRKRVLLEKELEIAQSIQKSFLPQGEVDFKGLDISSSIQPAKYVAGDLFDFVRISDTKLGVLIGDVAGKGVPASLIMAQIISIFRVLARQPCDGAAVILDAINKEIVGRISTRFATCMYLVVDTAQNKVCVASAGHGPLLLYKKKTRATVEIELNAGFPLGISLESSFDNVFFDIEEGDKIVIFTDGLTEARDVRASEFGVERIKKIVTENGGEAPSRMAASLMEGVGHFAVHCVQHDDMTLIILGRSSDGA
jgi:CHASE2 domain-containing sensor protein